MGPKEGLVLNVAKKDVVVETVDSVAVQRKKTQALITKFFKSDVKTGLSAATAVCAADLPRNVSTNGKPCNDLQK